MQETAEVAPALALAELQIATLSLLSEGTPATGQADRHCPRTTTRDTTAFMYREPLAIRRMPFMHNV